LPRRICGGVQQNCAMRPATTIVLALILFALFGAAIIQLFFMTSSSGDTAVVTGLLRAAVR
jgi:hypothetical protein